MINHFIFQLQRRTPRWRVLANLPTSLLVSTLVFAQQPSTSAPVVPPTGESKAAIDKALEPIGSEQSIRNLDSCIVTGTLKQGVAKGTFTWKNAAQEYWAESDINSLHTVAASNHGKPMHLSNGNVRPPPPSKMGISVPLYNVGMSVLRSREDATRAMDVSAATSTHPLELHITQVKPSGARRPNSSAASSTGLSKDIEPSNETWAFDPQTGLPASHVFKPYTYLGRPLAWTAQYKFSDYRLVSGVNVPHHIERYLDDQLIHTFDIQSIQCGIALTEHDFELNEGAR